MSPTPAVRGVRSGRVVPLFLLAAALSCSAPSFFPTVSAQPYAGPWPALGGGVARSGVSSVSLPSAGQGQGQSAQLSWSVPTSGWSVSGPSVGSNGRFYFGSNVDNSFNALDGSSGASLFSFPTGGSISSTAALGGGRAFFSSGDGFLYALNWTSGAQLWRTSLGCDGSLSPVLDGSGAVIAACGSGVAALSPASGAVLWSVATAISATISSPALDGDGNVVLLSSAPNALLLSGTSGAVLKSCPVGATATVLSPPSTGARGAVYFATNFNSNTNGLTALNLSSCSVLWTNGGFSSNSMGFIFSSSPPLVWPARGIVATVAAASQGNLHVMSANITSGASIWSSAKLTGHGMAMSCGSLVASKDGSTLLFAGGAGIYGFDPTSGNQQWTYALGASTAQNVGGMALAAESGMLYVSFQVVNSMNMAGTMLGFSLSTPMGPKSPNVVIGTICPGGYYAGATPGSRTCVLCPYGTYSAPGGLNSDACLLCAPGSYALYGFAACAPCGPGSFAAVAGAASCTNCPPGTAQNTSGSASAGDCLACAPGTYAALGGSLACQGCPAGFFTGPAPTAGAGTGHASCSPCPAGSFSAGGGSCSICPPASFSAAGAPACSPCGAGSFVTASAGGGGFACSFCPSGTALNGTGTASADCAACAPGTISPYPGATRCSPVSAGYYAVSPSAAAPCPAGTFSPHSGAASAAGCLACPSDTYSNPGAASCLPCALGGSLSSSPPCVAASGTPAPTLAATATAAASTTPAATPADSATASSSAATTASPSRAAMTAVGSGAAALASGGGDTASGSAGSSTSTGALLGTIAASIVLGLAFISIAVYKGLQARAAAGGSAGASASGVEAAAGAQQQPHSSGDVAFSAANPLAKQQQRATAHTGGTASGGAPAKGAGASWLPESINVSKTSSSRSLQDDVARGAVMFQPSKVRAELALESEDDHL